MAYGWSKKDNVIVAHAVLGGLLAMFIWPAMALVGRYMRAYPKWNRIHSSIGYVLAFPILVVVFALGTWHVGSGGAWSTLHFRLGLALLILGLVQPIYGTLLHQFGESLPRTGARSLLRWFHPITGIVILALGWLQVYSGYGQWPGAGPGAKVPYGLTIAWAVLVGVWGALYLGGVALLPKQWKMWKDEPVKTEAGARTSESP